MEDDMINFEWRDISNLAKYQINNAGTVRNKKSEKNVKASYDGRYWRVRLITDDKNEQGKYIGRNFAIHRLVAIMFIENEDERRKFIDHIDGNKDNFDISNLRWVTPTENSNYGYDARGKKAIIQLDKNDNVIKRWKSASEIKEQHPEYNIGHISSCCHKRKKVKSHKGFKWEYEITTVKKESRTLYEDEIFINLGMFDDFDLSAYFVSNYGMIKNTREMILTPFDDRGYVAYMLYDKKTGKSHQILAHRAVAFKFCDGRTVERNTVNHLNEKRDDNFHRNLEWVTPQENSEHSVAKAVDKFSLKGEFIEEFTSMTLAATSIGKNTGSISSCCNGKQKSAYGFKWGFALAYPDLRIIDSK